MNVKNDYCSNNLLKSENFHEKNHNDSYCSNTAILSRVKNIEITGSGGWCVR